MGLQSSSLPSQSQLLHSTFVMAQRNTWSIILVNAHLTMRAGCSARLIAYCHRTRTGLRDTQHWSSNMLFLVQMDESFGNFVF
jgi:hypothetical protein